MKFDGEEHTYNLVDAYKNKKKTFKDTIDLKKINADELVKITQDIPNQVVYSEKGSNIVITAYDTQDVTYKKVEIVKIKDSPETKGGNKGKFACVVKTYKAIVGENGKVTGYEKDPESTSKTKYYREADIVTSYQTLNSKNKVIDTVVSEIEITGQDKTIVNTGKVLGTVTYKNGAEFDNDVFLDTDTIDSINLFTQIYAPQKSGKKYTGTWLQEEATSTSANETFNLGVNRSSLGADIIYYDMSEKQGKDTLVLEKGSRVNIALENGDDVVKTFSKNKNNIIVKLGETSDYNSAAYTKHEVIITKEDGKYYCQEKNYEWDDDLGDFAYIGTWGKYEFSNAAWKDYEESLGFKLTIGTNTYYQDAGYPYHYYKGSAEPTVQITIKDYLKLAEDGVTLNGVPLKYLLEDDIKGVSVLGDKTSIKKQKLAGTFLKETFNGGTNNDTITTGSDNDTIYLSGGKDTVTVDGTGIKKLDFNGDPDVLGQTTVKFAKNISFALPEDGVLPEGKTALNLAAVYNNDDFDFQLVKSGNDLVLDTGAYARASNVVYGTKYPVSTSTLTVSNFFAENGALAGTVFDYDNEDNPMTLNDLNNKEEGVTMYQFGNAKKANKISDTVYKDWLIGGDKADKFTVSNGNATIVGLKGNDTISVEETATGTVSIAETMGSGNDTLTIDPTVGEKVEFMVNGAYSEMMTSDKADISFEKTGNDLIFNMTYFKDTEAGIKKDINDSLTIKNFFNNEFDVAFGYNDEEPADWYEVNAALGKYLTVNGVKDTDRTSPTYNEIKFEGTSYNDKMTYSGSASALMFGAEGDDLYEIKLTKNKADLYLYDASGENEVVLASGKDDYRLLFNADKDGVVVDDSEGGMDSLLIFDSKSLTMSNIANVFKGKASGSVEIDDYFDKVVDPEKGTYKFKVTEKAGTESFDMSGYIDQVTENVQAWFNTEGNKYADYTAIEVLNSGDRTAISDLIACYNVQYSEPQLG